MHYQYRKESQDRYQKRKESMRPLIRKPERNETMEFGRKVIAYLTGEKCNG